MQALRTISRIILVLIVFSLLFRITEVVCGIDISFWFNIVVSLFIYPAILGDKDL